MIFICATFKFKCAKSIEYFNACRILAPAFILTFIVKRFVKQTVHQTRTSVELWRKANLHALACNISRPPRQDPAQVDLQPPEGCVPDQAHALSDGRTPVSRKIARATGLSATARAPPHADLHTGMSLWTVRCNKLQSKEAQTFQPCPVEGSASCRPPTSQRRQADAPRSTGRRARTRARPRAWAGRCRPAARRFRR